MKERLEGGFINQVFREDGVVAKEFMGEELVGKSARSRLLREEYALKRFGGDLGPKFLGLDDEGRLLQEFLEGGVIEGKIEQEDYFEAGRLLNRIHQPVVSNFRYVRKGLMDKWQKALSVVAPIIESEGIKLRAFIDWNAVEEAGVVRVHRDFWFGNLINTSMGMKAIDWEFAGVGSPYEDLAIVELWMIREYEDKFPKGRELFYQGYGREVTPWLVREFLKFKCLEFLATTTLEEYKEEMEADGFYHNKIKTLRTLL